MEGRAAFECGLSFHFVRRIRASSIEPFSVEIQLFCII